MRNTTSVLQEIITNILMNSPNGINHVALVRRVLEEGYVSEHNSISEDVMRLVKRMIKKKIIVKNLDTRIITNSRPLLVS